ncbi:hypothetical protein EOM81_07590 [bacterium]|nr:hypothetical protein [bacterium]
MFDYIVSFANCYFIALFTFLIYIRKSFLQMPGNETLPSLDLNYTDEQAQYDAENEIIVNSNI